MQLKSSSSKWRSYPRGDGWTAKLSNIYAFETKPYIRSTTAKPSCFFLDNGVFFSFPFFTRGQCWPSGIVVACVCLCVLVCVCINYLLVRAITRGLFKLGSPNLDLRCKRPWLRSLLFLTSKSKLTPFWACPRNNVTPVQARTTKFGPDVENTLVKIPIVLEVDWAWHVKLSLCSKSCIFASLLCLGNVCETRKNIWKRSLFHILNGWAQICLPTASCHGQWDSPIVFTVTIAGFPVLDSAIGNIYLMLL